MARSPQRVGYRMALVKLDPDGPAVRVKVVRFERQDGMVVRWTQHCSGCTPGYEESGGAHFERGAGCSECGYTGRSRRVEWVPLPEGEVGTERADDPQHAEHHAPR